MSFELDPQIFLVALSCGTFWISAAPCLTELSDSSAFLVHDQRTKGALEDDASRAQCGDAWMLGVLSKSQRTPAPTPWSEDGDGTLPASHRFGLRLAALKEVAR